MSTFISDASVLDVEWYKSSFSGSNSNCVETGLLADAALVRDSKAAHGPALAFAPSTWSAFLSGVKADTFSANA
ncbi:DUF397 domain-containing protein [Streptomyces sp. NPDC058240]|uniref:DUF397 domain-containing protein n=1 Tax=Streptomyces sp. NPDC058240 TaxID=3346396 RepID=UPI0036E7E430